MRRFDVKLRTACRFTVAALLFSAGLDVGGAAQSVAGNVREGCADAAPAAAVKPADAPMTQAQGAAILDELRRIETLLASGRSVEERPNAGSGGAGETRIKIGPSWNALGRPDAPVLMLEFADLQCPFCQKFQSASFARLKADYIDTGKVRFVALDLPLPIHQYARAAAEAERCAGAQGKFWEFRDGLLSEGGPPTPEKIAEEAQRLRIDLGSFEKCRESNPFIADIKTDEADAAAAGINGTPSFVIGRAAGGWVSGVKMRGNHPYEAFKAAIEAALSRSDKGETTAASR